MFNITQIRGNNQHAAAHYFSKADDYYAKENCGEWQGKGAEVLRLSGAIEQAQLARMLNGQLPNGERIQTTFDATQNKKRMGLDLTFSAPKSVSMQALVAGDRAVTDAHDKAVARAVTQIEKLAETRKKIKGKSYRERTGNMVVGKFRHEMSRAKDPQLHTHAVVMNMTQRTDGAWRALCNEDLYRVQHEIDGIYKAELARELQDIGYQIRVVDDLGNFELAHINRQQIEAFSERSRIIEDALANDGKTRATASTLEKQIISLATRPRKEKSDIELIKQYWIEKSRELNIDYGARSNFGDRGYEIKESMNSQNNTKADAVVVLPAGLTPEQVVVQYSINHLTEREAVVKESVLVATAMRRAVGMTGSKEIKDEIRRLLKQGTLIEAVPTYKIASDKTSQALSAEGWKSHLKELKGWTTKQADSYVKNAIKQRSLIESEKRYTTQKALKREQVILAIERTGRGTVVPILSAAVVQKALENSTLNEGQRSAVQAMLSTANRFVGIQGDAGTGKTYTVNQAVELIEQANKSSEGQGGSYRTIALAPYGNQVKALKTEGFEAHTLASFLSTKNKPIDSNTLIILDEAGVVNARQMEQLMRVVEKSGARMALLGDTKQTEAIEAGKPFAQLQKEGMQTVRINEIQRQQNPELKRSVEYAAEGHVNDSLAHIQYIEQIPDATNRHRTIVNDYMKLTEMERRNTLIVAGTNTARREINNMVRSSLELKGKGREFDTLTRVDMTQAQRRFAPSFMKDAANRAECIKDIVIQPDKDYPKMGLVRGETYTVKDTLPGNLLVVEKRDGTTLEINPRKATQLSVYYLERPEFSVGDIVRINRNDPALNLTNGDRMKVVGILGGTIRLESVEQKEGHCVRTLELLSNKPLHLEHSYSSTVHGSQGLTSDRSMIALDTTSRTTSMNLYYVAISRAKHEARIYTNSVEGLPAAIARRYDKTAALEIQRERQLQRGISPLHPKMVADGKRQIERLKRQPEVNKKF